MHPRIAVHGLCGWTAPLEEDLAFYKREGIDYVSVAMLKLDKVGRDEGVELVRAADLRIAHVTVTDGFDLAQPSEWERKREDLCEVIDIATRLSAERVCMSAGPAGVLLADDAAEAFVEAMAPVRTYAESAGVPLILEHNHLIRRDLSFLNSLRDVIEFGRDQHIDACLEVQNCWYEGHLQRTINDGIDLIKLMQISDWAKADIHLPTERAVMGDGDLPLKPIMRMLLDAGFEGAFEIEVVGPKIEAEGYQSAVMRSIAWLEQALGELGV